MKRSRNHTSHWFLIFVAAVIILIGGTSIIYHEVRQPVDSAKSQSLKIAKKYGHLKKETAFSWASYDQTYYTVTGTNQQNAPIYVIISNNGKKVRIFKQSAGINRNDVLKQVWNNDNPKKVTTISMGIFKKKPVWEVGYMNASGQLCLKTLNFKNGEVVRHVNNI
ncbi:DUF5590 domain-containing protein [Pediococcus damnosus]|uniref:cell wall elongation regulator TseB-like domain-containing protein n=1 Tax=Pediococcus damnosus TaxID=51663 RepID=UPI0011A8E203|nr:DUF5590 domain-containing protein [Pediococcus damnosus]